ncbi:MAG: hypothetical protein P8Y97_16350 [Candidatus Lokiarchaeota archaeon]
MFLERLKVTPKNAVLIIIVIMGFLIFILINQLVFTPLGNMVSTYGILNFEFAFSKEQVLNIFSAWGTQGIALEVLGVYWDFLYIIGYLSLIFGSILLVLRQSDVKLQKIGYWGLLTPVLAGIFDIIENVNLLLMLNLTPTFPAFIPLITSISALLKFGFLIIAIAFFCIILVIFIIQKIKKKRSL